MPLSAAGRATGHPRVGFVGLGWIGLHRMRAIVDTGAVEVCAVADLSEEARAAAQSAAPGAVACGSLEEVLAQGPDGVVIATPSALHAQQAIAALEAGAAVFCQKPLGRDADEAEAAVAAARRADRLLSVDLSYRHTAAMQAIRKVVRDGGLGRIFATDLTFHNAYGPDKAWFYDRRWAGGGCVMDLGVHMVDLALWLLDQPRVTGASARLRSGGAPVPEDGVEDYAEATLDTEDGAILRLTCSWNLPAGRDAVIAASFHGTDGGAALTNVRGSFFDFEAHHHRGTATALLAAQPDDWGGRAAADWARRLAAGERFDPAAQELVTLSRALDLIYAADAPARMRVAV